MQKISFTVEDLGSPDRLERVLRQFQSAILEVERGAMPPPMDVQAVANQVVAYLRPQLEATGSTPINIGNLLPINKSSTTTP